MSDRQDVIKTTSLLFDLCKLVRPSL